MCKLLEKLKDFIFGLSYVVAVLFAVAIIFYIVKTNFGVDGEPVGFQLATISAVIGGLILASAGLSSYASAQQKMKRIGVLYLMATVSFVIFGICFPIIEWNDLMPWIAGTGMVVGAFSFAIATIFLAYTLPSIWSDSN